MKPFIQHPTHPSTVLPNPLLGMPLCMVAGSMNAGGFLLLGGALVSHVTGSWTRTGLELGRGDPGTSFKFFALAGSYLVGAMLATFLIEAPLGPSRRVRYVRPLIVEILLLALIGIIGHQVDTPEHLWHTGLSALVSFTMGLQNATISKVSGTVMRTTHMTGATTDFGIELARLFLLIRDEARAKWRGVPPATSPERGFLRTILAESSRALALGCLIAAFAAGACLGAVTFGRYGYLGVVPPCMILASVVAVSLRNIRAEKLGIIPTAPITRHFPRSTIVKPSEVPPPPSGEASP